MTNASLNLPKRVLRESTSIEIKKELEETTLEYNLCDNTCTNKDTLRMHKGVTH